MLAHYSLRFAYHLEGEAKRQHSLYGTSGIRPTSQNSVSANFGEYPFHAVSILEGGCGRRLGAA
jgi:hypothetical protein